MYKITKENPVILTIGKTGVFHEDTEITGLEVVIEAREEPAKLVLRPMELEHPIAAEGFLAGRIIGTIERGFGWRSNAVEIDVQCAGEIVPLDIRVIPEGAFCDHPS